MIMTVQELIDALQKYPKDALVELNCEEYTAYVYHVDSWYYSESDNILTIFAEGVS